MQGDHEPKVLGRTEAEDAFLQLPEALQLPEPDAKDLPGCRSFASRPSPWVPHHLKSQARVLVCWLGPCPMFSCCVVVEVFGAHGYSACQGPDPLRRFRARRSKADVVSCFEVVQHSISFCFCCCTTSTCMGTLQGYSGLNMLCLEFRCCILF